MVSEHYYVERFQRGSTVREGWSFEDEGDAGIIKVPFSARSLVNPECPQQADFYMDQE
jgi:hypothetical protein